MPITPRFKIKQTETKLEIIIHLPHIRVSASTLDMLVDGYDFHFHSSPYLLYLSFPGRMVDDAETLREAKATYDPSNQNGVLTVSIFKEDEGYWKDLDLLGNLVNNGSSGDFPSQTAPREKIQVMDSSETPSEGNDVKNHEDNRTCFTNDIQSCLKPHYGFLNMHHSVFTAYAREGLSFEMLEIPNPDEMPEDKRRETRLSVEFEKFDGDRYLGDLFLSSDPNDEEADMIFIEAMRMETHWSDSTSVGDLISDMERLKTEDVDPGESLNQDFFSDDERLQMVDNKAQIPPMNTITQEQSESLYLSLIDILYAYVYDHRTTMGDATCESSWTIVMLSPTLSWFESYTPPYDTIRSVFQWDIRRAMIYPYLRNYAFVGETLVSDVCKILDGGKRVIIRSLLQIQKILEGSEFHYLFNKLYINQFISWIQKVEEGDLKKFASKVKSEVKKPFDKACFGLDLDSLEEEAFGIPEGDEEDESSSEESSSDGDDSSENSEDEDSRDRHDQSTFVEGSSTNLLDDNIGRSNILLVDQSSEVKGLVTKSQKQEKKQSLIVELE